MRRLTPVADTAGLPTTTECSLLVVEPCRLYRDALATQLESLGSTTAVRAVATAAEALAVWEAQRADIAVVAMQTPDAVALIRALREADPAARIVAVDVAEDEQAIIACAELGVAGLLPRGADLADLERMVADVLRGQTSCSPLVATALLKRVHATAAEQNSTPGEEDARLTPREREVLALIELGWSNKQIAQELCIEVRTVKNHVHNLLEKLRVSRRGEAAARLRSSRMPGLGVLRAAQAGTGPSGPGF